SGTTQRLQPSWWRSLLPAGDSPVTHPGLSGIAGCRLPVAGLFLDRLPLRQQQRLLLPRRRHLRLPQNPRLLQRLLPHDPILDLLRQPPPPLPPPLLPGARNPVGVAPERHRSIATGQLGAELVHRARPAGRVLGQRPQDEALGG